MSPRISELKTISLSGDINQLRNPTNLLYVGRDFNQNPSQNDGFAFMIPSQASAGFFFQKYGPNVIEESFALDSDQLIEKFTTTTTTTTTTTSKTITVRGIQDVSARF